MSKDLLFDEKFEVRKQIYTRKINPFFEVPVRIVWKLKNRVYVWFGGKVPEIKSIEEVKERNDLMYRLEECYLEIPQRMPDQQWFHDLIDHYQKYNDYEGALDIWQWISAHQIWIDMDQEVIDKFQNFFEINDPKSLTQLSDHQKALRLQLLEGFKKMDNNPERWYKKRQVNILSARRPADKLVKGDRLGGGGGF